MSNQVFPSNLPGLSWGIRKTPLWATQVADAASGRQYTLGKRLYPLWRFSLPYEFLRASASTGDLQTLVGFINARRGRYDDFLYMDPRDCNVSAQSIGNGDGVTKTFSLVRSFGGFLEPTPDVDASSVTLFKNAGDWRGNERQYTTARKNLCLYSEQLDNAAWSRNVSTVTANAATAPDGTNNADKLIGLAGVASHNVAQQFAAFGNGSVIVHSIHAKPAEYSKIQLTVQNRAGSYVGSGFDLATGATFNTAAGVTAAINGVANGFYRCSVAVNVGSGATTPTAFTELLDNTGTNSFNGDGVSGAYLWGAQTEADAVTPYIPTTNAAVTVTDATLAALQAGTVTFATAPQNGAALTWSGRFYFRCRFLKDAIDFEQFLQDLWSAKAVEFQTFRP